MIYFTIRCDSVPGKEEELDRLLAERSKKFWLAQPGVKSFHVYADKLFGWPERTIMIEVQDLATLQRILDSPERKTLRKDALAIIGRSESQIIETVV